MRQSRTSRIVLAGSALLAAQSFAWSARAGEADKGAAQVLFEQGRALVQERRFAEACPRFAESLRLDPGIGTMLWLADCYENSGKTASAWAEFKEAAATATLQHDERAALARKRADELEPRLAKLVLVPPAEGSVPGIEVMRDGVLVGAPELGIPVPVNPGVHEVRASAARRKAWSRSVTIVDKPGTVSVVIPVLEALPEGANPMPTTGTDPSTTTTRQEPLAEKGTWGPRQTAAVGTAGVGLVALGLGSFFGLDAKSTYDGWASTCKGMESSVACIQQRGAATNQAYAADVLFPVGAAALVAGAVLYFAAPKTSTGTVAVTPVVSPWGAGMAVSKAW